VTATACLVVWFNDGRNHLVEALFAADVG